ncbi:PREDICTED: uncharacterized protein LOC102812504 [Chrysochloris asiatica]|uniref:Uncharacterized protein LOC102812504 n=1 Tax=Chrysochloris asiatica TaxID=185453 RepID=A0A9B0WNK6_CHRAS|nr:PREDICTED: uncharacterized protein LOC102812504 [Chrysochloris asiatica]
MPDGSSSTLKINSTELGDSAVYLCASSLATVWHCHPLPEQKPSGFPVACTASAGYTGRPGSAMHSQVLCCMALCLLGAGAAGSGITQTPKYMVQEEGQRVTLESPGFSAHVSQHPSRAIRRSGTMVEMDCHAKGIQASTMLWYRQLPGQTFTLIAVSNQGSDPTYEQGFTKTKFTINHPNLTFSALTVTNVKAEDSSLYFCAASDTALSRHRGPEQERLPTPHCRACSMDTEVIQTPGQLVKGTKQKARMECVPIKGHDDVYWYRQKPGEELKFLIRFQYQEAFDSSGMPEKRFSANCSKISPCSMEIEPTEPEDSAVYFCASSLSTVL